jgi:hypothetical protein
VGEDVADGRRVGDEGDDPYFGAAGAAERENVVDAGEQQRPGVAGGGASGVVAAASARAVTAARSGELGASTPK